MGGFYSGGIGLYSVGGLSGSLNIANIAKQLQTLPLQKVLQNTDF